VADPEGEKGSICGPQAGSKRPQKVKVERAMHNLIEGGSVSRPLFTGKRIFPWRSTWLKKWV
jgi:hypothetical protein